MNVRFFVWGFEWFLALHLDRCGLVVQIGIMVVSGWFIVLCLWFRAVFGFRLFFF